MNDLKLFRAVVITEFVLVIVACVTAFFAEELPEAVNEYLAGPGAGPLWRWAESSSDGLFFVIGLVVLLVVVSVAVMIGLLLFKLWARIGYIALFIFGVATYPFLGATIHTPVAGTVEYLMNAFSGAVLVLLFVDSVRKRFAISDPS